MKKSIYMEVTYRGKWLGFVMLFIVVAAVHAQDTTVCKAVEDFNHIINGYVPFYVNNQYLAINPLQHEDKAGAATVIYKGTKNGIFTVAIEVKQEFDGESMYRLVIAGKEYDKLQYNRVPEDKEKDTTLFWNEVTINTGDTVKIEAQANSNKIYPEASAPGGFAWSRGRWSTLTLMFDEPVPIVPNSHCFKGNTSFTAHIRGNRLYVITPFDKKYSLSLYNAKGKALIKYIRDAGSVEPVLLKSFGPGVYVVSVSSVAKTLSRKVVIK